jgi:aldehyde dehydrogenase (NAD+)
MTAAAPNRIPQTTGKAPTPHTGFDRLFISGRWVTGRSEHKVSPIDPYRRTPIVEIPATNQQDIDRRLRFALQMEAEMTHINDRSLDYVQHTPRTYPF